MKIEYEAPNPETARKVRGLLLIESYTVHLQYVEAATGLTKVAAVVISQADNLTSSDEIAAFVIQKAGLAPGDMPLDY